MVLEGFKPDLDDQLDSFSALTLLVWSSGRKNRPRNDLLCVEWDVKPYTHSIQPSLVIMFANNDSHMNHAAACN